MFSLGFSSVLWLDHSWRRFNLNYSTAAVTEWLGLISCTNLNLSSRLKSFSASNRMFSPRFTSHASAPSTLISFSVTAKTKNIPTAWCRHHRHVPHVLQASQKIQFWSHLTRIPFPSIVVFFSPTVWSAKLQVVLLTDSPPDHNTNEKCLLNTATQTWVGTFWKESKVKYLSRCGISRRRKGLIYTGVAATYPRWARSEEDTCAQTRIMI